MRKNRSKYWLIVIAGEVITVGLTAWGVTAIILRWKKEKNTPVEVTEYALCA